MNPTDGLMIFRIRGIAVRVHWSWLLVFTLVTYSLAEGFLIDEFPTWGVAQRGAVAVICALVFFLSVLLHELAHAFVALRYRMRVPSITLFIFGGVSHIDGEMQSAGQEFRIALAGPLCSLVIAAVLLVTGFALWPRSIAQLALYLGLVNVTLGVFNLLPGFPLDGGRVFRSAVWARTGDLTKATRTAARLGTSIAWLMIGGGVLALLTIGLTGLWYILIGLFLKSASEQALSQLLVERAIGSLRTADIMREPPEPVDASVLLSVLVETHVLGRGERCVLLATNGGVSGLITISDIARVARDRLPLTRASEVMIPAERVVTVQPATPITDAMRLMAERDIHQVPVIEDGRLVGILSRADLLQQVETRLRFSGDRP